MKKYLKLIYVLMLAGMVCACSDKNDEPEEWTDDDTDYEEAPEVVSDGSVCQLPTAILAANIPDYLKAQVDTRFVSATSAIGPDTRVVLVSEAALMSKSQEIYDAYKRGATIVLAKVDKHVALQWLKDHDIAYCGDPDDFEDLHLVYAFNNRDCYLLFDDINEEDCEVEIGMIPVRFDSLIDWLNTYACEDEADKLAVNSRAGDVYDIAQVFGSQVVRHNFVISIEDAELTHVIASKIDKISKASSIDVNFTIYPLYSAKSNGSSAGDYYIIEGYVNAHNGPMFQGKKTYKHLGVRARTAAFYMSKLTFSAEVESNTTVTFPSKGTPVPQTTALATTYTSGFSWSIGGSITGKYMSDGGKEPNTPPTPSTSGGNSPGGSGSGSAPIIRAGGVDGGLSATFTWNNSEMRSLPDVTINRDTPGGKIKWTYNFNNLPYTSGGKKYLNIPGLATSDFECNHTWIWWMPDSKEGDTSSYSVKLQVEPIYKSYKWYSSAADFDVYTWDKKTKKGKYILGNDGIFKFKLVPPQRVPQQSQE